MVDKLLEECLGKVCSSQRVFKPGVSTTWEDIFEAPKLLNSPESLEMRGVNKVPDNLREVDEVMDVVIDLPHLPRVICLMPVAAILLVADLHLRILIFSLHNYLYIYQKGVNMVYVDIVV